MQIITVLWGISILVAVLGGVPYMIWVIWTALRKNWKKVGWLMGFPLCFFALLTGVTVIVKSASDAQYVRDIYGADADLKLRNAHLRAWN